MKQPTKPLEELLDSVRDIEGFPIGTDEDILKLSNPPYYTACPNPYINDFIREYGTPYDEVTDNYHRDPFVGDVSEGKNTPIYNAHGYHTKVPHTAIMKYIEHYTDEGDIVFDGFCGTGMTGVAAQMLNRKAVLSDLSPIASYITHNYNSNIDINKFEIESNRIMLEVEDECGWMYETQHAEGKEKNTLDTNVTKGKINFTVWSDVFLCSYCGGEIVFYDSAVNKETGQVSKIFPCPHCHATMKKTECERARVHIYDAVIGKKILQAKQVPVLINYSIGKTRFEKKPDTFDLDIINKLNNENIPYWFPTNKIEKGDKTAEPLRLGISHMHHYYTKRSLWTLGLVFKKISQLSSSKNIQNPLQFAFEQTILGFAKISRYVPTHFSQVNQYLSGTLYIGSQHVEISLPYIMKGKLKRLLTAFLALKNNKVGGTITAAQSATSLDTMKDNSIDYIFTDPPFGSNLMYSELNFLHESWMKVRTNNKSEAIINKSQSKKLTNYNHLMHQSFKEYFRVLKPNRWITVEFHSSKSSIWNGIQDGISKAGFIIASVAVLDKQQGSFNQVLGAGSVKNDLVISAYKPTTSFQHKFLEQAGEGLEEEFIKMHLNHLSTEPSIERTEQMLYSKLLAYYVQRSYTVKYDASTFYKMLRENFTEEDGFWFISSQIESYLEYKQKMKLDGIDDIRAGQLNLFVSDEKTALVWLHNFLNEPQDFQVIHPAFTKVASISGDIVPDLKELLQDNFILEDGKYRRPKSEDEKNSVNSKREKTLIKEFEEVLLEAKSSKRKIKECRKQVILYGFEQCYKQEKFQDILEVGKKLNQNIIENDSDINEFIEIAEIKIEGF